MSIAEDDSTEDRAGMSLPAPQDKDTPPSVQPVIQVLQAWFNTQPVSNLDVPWFDDEEPKQSTHELVHRYSEIMYILHSYVC